MQCGSWDAQVRSVAARKSDKERGKRKERGSPKVQRWREEKGIALARAGHAVEWDKRCPRGQEGGETGQVLPGEREGDLNLH